MLRGWLISCSPVDVVRWSQRSQDIHPQSLKRETLTWQTHKVLLVMPGKGSTTLLPTASASCSSSIIFYHLTGARRERLLGKQIYPLPATQFVSRSWHRELLHFLAQEVTQDGPPESPQDSGKRNSFLRGVQSCPPGLVSAACVASASLFAWSPWGHKALVGFPASSTGTEREENLTGLIRGPSHMELQDMQLFQSMIVLSLEF